MYIALTHHLLMSCARSLVAIPLMTMAITTSADEQLIVTTNPDQLVTVKAVNVPLKVVVEQIAHDLDIEVETKSVGNQLVSDDFDNLPLDRALQRLNANYIAVTEKNSDRIAKIFLLPAGKAAPRIVTESRPPAVPETMMAPKTSTQQAQRTNETAVSTPSADEDDSANQGDSSNKGKQDE